MKKKTVQDHFDSYAESWVENSYRGWGYVYPTARHRADIVCRIFSGAEGPLTVADLGCGAGTLSILLAEQGYRVTGVDQSESMLALAQAAATDLPGDIRERVKFHHAELENPGLPKGQFDVVASMGVIGYLDSDDPLFATASSLLKPGGTFAVSCRNRLFNMNSLSFRTTREIENGTAADLIDEMAEYYQSVPENEIRNVLRRLRDVATALTDASFDGIAPERSDDLPEEPPLEARQHTPRELTATATRFAFEPKGFYGLHPHLIDPNVNRLLPPGVFNTLSSCLEALDHLPVSLAWSSAFIGVFEKPHSSDSGKAK